MSIQEQEDWTAEIAEAMRTAMRRFAQSVSVISTSHDGQRIALAATAVNSLSLVPPSMLAVVNRSASIYSALRSGARFCINVLNADQKEIADACGGKLKGEARFGVGKWDYVEGLPCLAEAQARLFCQQDGFVTYGTRGMFIGRILRAEFGPEKAPLIYSDGRYRALQSV